MAEKERGQKAIWQIENFDPQIIGISFQKKYLSNLQISTREFETHSGIYKPRWKYSNLRSA